MNPSLLSFSSTCPLILLCVLFGLLGPTPCHARATLPSSHLNRHQRAASGRREYTDMGYRRALHVRSRQRSVTAARVAAARLQKAQALNVTTKSTMSTNPTRSVKSGRRSASSASSASPVTTSSISTASAKSSRPVVLPAVAGKWSEVWFNSWNDAFFFLWNSVSKTEEELCPVQNSQKMEECCFTDGCGHFVCAPVGGLLYDACHKVAFGLSDTCVFKRIECCVPDPCSRGEEQCFTYEYAGNWYHGYQHPKTTIDNDFFCQGVSVLVKENKCVADIIRDRDDVMTHGVEFLLTREFREILKQEHGNIDNFYIDWDDDDEGFEDLADFDDDDILFRQTSGKEEEHEGQQRATDSDSDSDSDSLGDRTSLRRGNPTPRPYPTKKYCTIGTKTPDSNFYRSMAQAMTKEKVDKHVKRKHNDNWKAHFVRIDKHVALSHNRYRYRVSYKVMKIAEH